MQGRGGREVVPDAAKARVRLVDGHERVAGPFVGQGRREGVSHVSLEGLDFPGVGVVGGQRRLEGREKRGGGGGGGGEKEETRGRTSLVGPSPPRPPTSSPPDGVAAAVAAAEKEEEGEEPSEEPSEEEEEEERRRERRSGPGFPLPPIFSRV